MSKAQRNPEISEHTEARASLLWWFATLLTRELDQQQVSDYIQGPGADFLNQLAQTPQLEPEVRALKQAFAGLGVMEHPQLELAADFCQLFLGDSHSGAPPYASVYLAANGMLYQGPHDQMVELLRAQGLAQSSGFNEPADHIAIQLDYLGNLVLRDGDTVSEEQTDFIQQHLLSWVSSWHRASLRVKNSGVYQALIGLLIHYLELELAENRA